MKILPIIVLLLVALPALAQDNNCYKPDIGREDMVKCLEAKHEQSKKEMEALREELSKANERLSKIENEPGIRPCVPCSTGTSYSCTRLEAANKCESLGMRLCTLAELGAYGEAGLATCCWGWVGDPPPPENFSRTTGTAAFVMGSSASTGYSSGCSGDPGGLRISNSVSHTQKYAAHCCRK
ncbi:MAG: hypothetical protein D3913_04140 [Candidatus Electrothrix sp. LOE1_4_5]|nr:hypothetical protein [Candidatus Electrothrix gigas]